MGGIGLRGVGGSLDVGVGTQIAKFMGPSGADRTQMAPCWPHEPCYQGMMGLVR